MLTRDPVCNIEVYTEETKFISIYKGKTYYFESGACKARFDLDPEAYTVPMTEKVYDRVGDRFDGSD